MTQQTLSQLKQHIADYMNELLRNFTQNLLETLSQQFTRIEKAKKECIQLYKRLKIEKASVSKMKNSVSKMLGMLEELDQLQSTEPHSSSIVEYYPSNPTSSTDLMNRPQPSEKAKNKSKIVQQPLSSRGSHRRFERRNSRGGVLTPNGSKHKHAQYNLFQQMLNKKAPLREVHIN